MNAQTVEFGTAILKMVGGLAVVLALVLGLAFFLKKLSNLSPKMGNDSLLRLISTHRIGPKQIIALYQVGSKAFLLGISQDNINFLTDISMEDLGVENKISNSTGDIAGKSFSAKLRTFMNFTAHKTEKEVEA